MLAQEHRAKHRGFSMSEESTVAGRNRAADYEAIELTSTIFELRGETKAYELEYEYLVLLIKQGELNPYGIDIDGSEIRTLDAVGSQEAGSLTS